MLSPHIANESPAQDTSRMVTYRAPWLTAWPAWVGAAAILAPVTASL
jgi:hypothetical protein